MDREQLLTAFFLKLQNTVLSEEKKLFSKSVLLTLEKITSNKASKLLNTSSIRSPLIDKQTFKELEELGFIRLGDVSHNEFVLTAAGIWEYEKKYKGLTENDLLDYFQKKNLAPALVNRGLTEKEKVVVLSLIGIRNFSLSTAMDVNIERTRDKWLEVLKECYEFLISNNYIKQDRTIFAKHGNEHQVSYLMVRLNDLPKSTQHIFNFAKGRQYYLDVIEDDQISKERLKFLYKLIFGKITDMEQLNKIVNFCTYLADEKGMFVCEDFQYINPSTAFLIKDSLQSFFREE